MALLAVLQFSLKLSLRSSRTFHAAFPSFSHPSATPQAIKAHLGRLSSPLSLTPTYYYHTIVPGLPQVTMSAYLSMSDQSMRDATPMIKFEDDTLFDSPRAHSEQMIFGPIDLEDGLQFSPDMALPWDSFEDVGSHNEQPYMSDSPSSPSHPFDFNFPQQSSHNALFNSGAYPGMSDMQSSEPQYGNEFHLSQWIKEPECPPLDASSSPIPIRPALSVPQTPPAFHSYIEQHPFPQNASFSPSDFASLHPLPRSASPSAFSGDSKQFPRFDNVGEMSMQPPNWAAQLWDAPSPSYPRSPASSRSPIPHSPLSRNGYAAKRQSFEPRKRTSSFGQAFQSSSAPSPVHSRAPALSRTYSRRAESTSVSDDRDATVRRKKRLSSPEVSRSVESTGGSRKHICYLSQSSY